MKGQQVVTVLTKPVAWQGRIVVWMVLLAVALFAGNQWLRLRSEIASGVVSIAGQRWPTRPVVAIDVPRIARQKVVRAPISEAVSVRPLTLTPKQEKALNSKFDLKLGETADKVIAVVETPPAPRGAEVVVTVDPQGVPEVVVKAKPPRFFELGPWELSASVVQEFADESAVFGRLALTKELRVGKAPIFGRISYDFGRDEIVRDPDGGETVIRRGRGVEGEIGLRLKF